MNNMVEMRLDLGIDARRFVQQIRLHNGSIEKQIEKGIELALNDIADSDNFIQLVRESTKMELGRIVHKVILSYDIQQSVQKMIADKISSKIEKYADEIAEQITNSLR